jgi:3-deoxy-D-manno-octulosonic acid kinase
LRVDERTVRLGNSVILYDASRVSHMREEWFTPQHWAGAATAPGYAGGRGDTLFIDAIGEQWVLRHYHRGGFVGRWLDDAYPWLGADRVRSHCEWRLLARLSAMGLPVPAPLAARYVRRGLVYTADLITVRLPDVVPLSTRLAAGPLEPDGWQRVGELVGLFHRHRVRHADLTAHNIQIDGHGRLFLLDFDRGRIMPRLGRWTDGNLARLKRSLTKIATESDGEIGFDASSWAGVILGYRESMAA